MSVRRKRRWFAFRLRTLMLVFALVGCSLMLFANKWRLERLAVDWVLDNEGMVLFDWQSEEDEPPGPKWIRAVVGDAPYQKALNINLTGTKINNVRMLRHLPSVKHLYLSSTSIKDIRPLAPMEQLIDLRLSHTQVHDISPLSKLSTLRYLSLEGTQVANLNPLRGLHELRYLALSDTKVDDLRPLSELKNLRYLTLRGAKLANLQPLTKLPHLKYLKLTNCQLTDLSPIKKCSKLQQLDLTGVTGPTWSQIVDLQWALPGCHVVRSKSKPARHHAARPGNRQGKNRP